MPVYDRAWLAHQPDLTPAELADVYALSTIHAPVATVEARTAAAATLLAASAPVAAFGGRGGVDDSRI
jgi:hypothetical protein